MTGNYCSCGCGREIGQKSKWAKGHNKNKNKDRFDWSNLEEDYLLLGSTVAVAEKYGCSHEAVSYQMNKKGIVVKLGKFSPGNKFEIKNVERLYAEQKSITIVAEMVGCSSTTVRERLKELGHKFTHDNKSFETEVGLGRYGERLALSLLKDSKDMNAIFINHPFDIEWEGKKIDVKVSRPRKRKRGQDQYSFSTKNNDCDYFLLIALDTDDNPRRLFLIPRKDITGKSVAFPYDFNSKWNIYKMEVNENELRKAVQSTTSIEG